MSKERYGEVCQRPWTSWARQSPRQPRQELSSPSTESSVENSLRVEDSEAAGKGGQLTEVPFLDHSQRRIGVHGVHTAIAKDVIPMVDKTPTSSSLALKFQLKGDASEEQFEAVCHEYTSLFSSQGLQVTPCEYLPPLLAPLVRFLRENRVGGFSNCAGKGFHLLSLEVNIRVATTSDPRHDWCGTPHF